MHNVTCRTSSIDADARAPAAARRCVERALARGCAGGKPKYQAQTRLHFSGKWKHPESVLSQSCFFSTFSRWRKKGVCSDSLFTFFAATGRVFIACKSEKVARDRRVTALLSQRGSPDCRFMKVCQTGKNKAKRGLEEQLGELEARQGRHPPGRTWSMTIPTTGTPSPQSLSAPASK